MTYKTAFITGVSRGLGLSFVKVLLEQGWKVIGCSRQAPSVSDKNFIFFPMDLSSPEQVSSILQENLKHKLPQQVNLIILNAGILHPMKDLKVTPLSHLKEMMDINLWCNKEILDFFFLHEIKIFQVLAISSGASINGHRGWGGYSLSKATLNMLIKLYAEEEKKTHFCALAPGLVETKMQDQLSQEKEIEKFPALKPILEARGTPKMPKPMEAAANILSKLDFFKGLPSGSYQDIRRIAG